MLSDYFSISFDYDTLDLNDNNLDDDNFDEDDPTSIVFVKLVASHNRLKQRKAYKTR